MGGPGVSAESQKMGTPNWAYEHNPQTQGAPVGRGKCTGPPAGAFYPACVAFNVAAFARLNYYN